MHVCTCMCAQPVNAGVCGVCARVLCVCLCVYNFDHARYLKSDLPDLVGPCNIDVWNESNLTGEEFIMKYE